MTQRLVQISLVVRDYDEALAFYVGKLGFTLIEDSFVPEQNKRWVVIEPPGATGRAPNYCWRAARTSISNRASATRPAAVCSCSSTPTTSGATTKAYKAQGVEFVREPIGSALRHASPCSRTCTARSGT